CLSSGNLYAPGAGSTPGGGGPADAGPVDEASPTYPSGRAPYYLASKLCGEIWASHLDQTDQIAVAVLRPSAIYGPGMSSGVVRVFVERLSAGLPVVLSDAGRYHSDLVFVGDVVQATIAALRQGARGVFNVGSGHSTSVAELAAALVAILGCDPQLVRSEPAGLHPSPGLAALDIQRALAAGLYAPTPLSVGLSRTLGIT
ncbi:MAG TPA: NAD-dependent epimerase/dehydratase family protein, partial [Deltaproteobacteria bacterium]|nr:NAD-dependent epimerase/dehydratase family protein [Deltaproteobacteria bacterium]